MFPRFQSNLPNNITTAAIQSWVDTGKAEIRARFLRRGLDPDSPSTLGWNPPLTQLTADQANVLLKFNAAYGIGMFMDAAYSALEEGEVSVGKRAWEVWKSMSSGTDGRDDNPLLRTSAKFILGNDGVYDALFSPNAAHVSISPTFAGVAGADYNPALVNNRTMGTFYMFEKGQKF